MRKLIIDLTNTTSLENSINAHTRNILEINKYLKFDIFPSGEKFLRLALKRKYEKIVFSYSSSRCPFFLINKLLDKNNDAKLYWVINDYKESPPSFLLNRKNVTVICNNKMSENRNFNFVHKWHLINLNSLILNDDKPNFKKRKHEIIYYGSYRINREKYFKEYLHSPVVISTSKKNIKKYKKIGCSSNIIDKLNWGTNPLEKFNFSLCMEDVKSHKIYSHAPNRIYESIFSGCLPIIDINMKRNLEMTNLFIPDCLYVNNYNDMINKIEKIDRQELSETLFDKNIEIMREEKNAALKNIVEILNG